MLNPFSISLAVQPLKIYRGLCLNEGSSLTHRAPLILGEKTNSCPADTRLTVLFPSPGDTQPLPRCHSSPPLQPHQMHLFSPTNCTSAAPHLQSHICSPSSAAPPRPGGSRGSGGAHLPNTHCSGAHCSPWPCWQPSIPGMLLWEVGALLPHCPACTGMGQATGASSAANGSVLVLLIPKP